MNLIRIAGFFIVLIVVALFVGYYFLHRKYKELGYEFDDLTNIEYNHLYGISNDDIIDISDTDKIDIE